MWAPTLVVQVLSFDLAWLSPVLLLLGVIMFLTARATIWRHLGTGRHPASA